MTIQTTTPIKKYKCIFFDLDHTLWDYETNSRETLQELFHEYELSQKGVTALEDFLVQFRKVNDDLWYRYDNGQIDSDVIRRERFKMILAPFRAYEEKLSDDLSRDYLHRCPQKGHLMPHAIEVLDYLSKEYRLAIITNGFEEIQHKKLGSGNLAHYFEHVVTSQKAGCRKPSRQIFECALKLQGITNEEAMMVGDNLITDIAGARNAAIDPVFFNAERIIHSAKPEREIHSLDELRSIL